MRPRVVPAFTVADPVVHRINGSGEQGGEVRGCVAGAAYVDFGRFSLALTAPGVPAMPNGIAVTDGGALEAIRPGDRAWSRPGWVRAGEVAVTWDPANPPHWSPSVTTTMNAPWVRARGSRILYSSGVASSEDILGLCQALRVPRGLTALELGVSILARSLSDLQPDTAASSAGHLVGLGPGLTPLGDDLLAGAAVTVASLGNLVTNPAAVQEWRSAVGGPDLYARTTSLSATLLEQALEGNTVEPVQALLGVSPADPVFGRALERVRALGSTTGMAYAIGVALASLLVPLRPKLQTQPSRDRRPPMFAHGEQA